LEGRPFVGTLPVSLLAIRETDPIRPTGPIEYNLRATRDDDDLLISGSLRAPFSLDCVRCLQPIDYLVEIDDYQIEIPIENDQIIDLTEGLREDILLTLPSYPRCEDGNVIPRDCSAEGQFEPDSEHEPDQPPAESKTAAWDVLDKLK
jgi:uncharacterized metal-binding protein YceD (DUF177 family)